MDFSFELSVKNNNWGLMDIEHMYTDIENYSVPIDILLSMLQSSVGMFVNKNFMKNKNEICFLTSGDKIMLSEKVPEFILKYYDDISHVPVFELKTLNENLAIINRKRKL